MDRSRGSDDDEDEPVADVHLEDAEGEKSDHEGEKSDHVSVNGLDLFEKVEADGFYDDHVSSGSEIEFVKSVTKSSLNEEHISAVDDTYMSTSSEGSVIDEEKGAKYEGNPFKT